MKRGLRDMTANCSFAQCLDPSSNKQQKTARRKVGVIGTPIVYLMVIIIFRQVHAIRLYTLKDSFPVGDIF